MSPDDLIDADPEAAQLIQASVQVETVDKVTKCAQDYFKRSRKAEFPAAGLKFNFAFVIESNGETGRISNVEVLDSPESIDEEMRSCLIDTYDKTEFPSSLEFGYHIEFPLQLLPPG